MWEISILPQCEFISNYNLRRQNPAALLPNNIFVLELFQNANFSQSWTRYTLEMKMTRLNNKVEKEKN